VKLAGTARGSKIYVEGQLTLSQWNAADGEVRHGLNVVTWIVEKVGSSAIGRQRPPRERGQE
jgi:single-stranded DNA-binding protein